MTNNTLNPKQITESSGSVFIAHIENEGLPNETIHPLIGICATQGCQFNYPDTCVITYDTQYKQILLQMDDYPHDVDYIKDLWSYIARHEPNSVSNQHLLFETANL